MNFQAIKAIYRFEMARMFRTAVQSIIAPVLSTSLYFVIFGAAIGSRITEIDGVSYGAFIVPGLIMLSIMTESISNSSFAIYFPKFTGTIFEVLSAPVSYVEVLFGYVGAAATKSVIIGSIIFITANFFVTIELAHPWVMLLFLVLTSISFCLFGFILGIWATGWEKAHDRTDTGHHAAHFSWRDVLLNQHAAGDLADDQPFQSGRVPDQRVSLELL